MRNLALCAFLLLSPSALAQTPTPSPSPSPEATPFVPGELGDEWSGPAPAATSWSTGESGGGLAVSGTTKSGSAERISDAAAQVTVLTSEEIAVFGHRTLADLIENAPESFIGGDRTYPILGVRGFARAGDKNTRILLLVDGHTLNEPWNNYAPGGSDLPLDLTQIERVEILAGPVSALYGSNAFFGAVQVVTRRPTVPTLGGSLTGGSARYGRGTAWYGNGSAGASPWSLLVSGTGSWTEGDDIRHADGLPTEQGVDWDQNGALTVRASRGSIAVLASAFSRRKGVISGAYGANYGDDRSYTEDSHGLLDVTWSALEREDVAVKLRAYGDYYRFDDLYRYDPEPVFRDVATSAWGGAEAVLSWTAGPNRLVASIEETAGRVVTDAYQETDGTDEPDPDLPPNSVPADTRSYNVVRGTVHDALQLGRRVKLEAGVYAEAHDQYGFAAAPRAAVVVQAPWSTSVKALYGRGFRSPSIYEAYYDDSDTVIGNPDLGAETADVVELALEKGLTERSDVFLSGFHGLYRELMVLETIDIDPAPASEDLRARFVNGGTARSSGATLACQMRRDAWVFWVDATGFVHDEETIRATQGAPEWVAHAIAIVRAGNRVTIGARASGVGARPARETGKRLDPYVLADVSVRVALGGGLFARVSGSNLLAADAPQPASEEYAPDEIPGVGPRGFFELRWEK